MKLMLNILFFCYLAWAICVIALNLNANIAFGKGLGDSFYLLILLILSVIYSIVYFKFFKKNTGNNYTVILFCAILIITVSYFFLKLTIWRGAEYPWNGELFLE